MLIKKSDNGICAAPLLKLSARPRLDPSSERSKAANLPRIHLARFGELGVSRGLVETGTVGDLGLAMMCWDSGRRQVVVVNMFGV